MLDCIIIGSGPAGLSAAINLKIRNVNFLIFGKDNLSEVLEKAPIINNYLGLPKITGVKLKNHFKNHLKELDININLETVINVYSMKDKFVVVTNNHQYESKTVIIATGKSKAKEYENENRLLGSGVSYCATCDGLFYKGKDVIVVGNNDESISDVKYLLGIASKVYYISKNKVENAICINSEIKSIEGKMHFEKVILKNNEEISANAIFIIRDSIKPDLLTPGLKVENNHILVDRYMHTNLKGLYACGDSTGYPYQYMKSCGEGQIAAFEVIKYLNEKAE